jgi:hypothetical protein
MMCSGYYSFPNTLYNESNKTTSDKFNINQNLVLYISAVVKKNANMKYISQIFKSLNIGDVDYVYFQDYGCTEGSKRATIYMKKWYNNIIVENLQLKIQDSKQQALLVHNDPEYWVLLENIDFQETIDKQNKYLKKIDTTIADMIIKLYAQDEKIKTFEHSFEKVNWTLKLHDANIAYWIQELNKVSLNQNTTTPVDKEFDADENESNARKLMRINNSCCGATSDAWVPSYPSSDSAGYRDWHISKS